MVLAINSSKTVLGVITTTAIGLATILFYRCCGDASAQTNAPSLTEKSIAILRHIPLVSGVINYFWPEVEKQPIISIGTSSEGVPSVEELAKSLKLEQQKYLAIDTLIIYGKNLDITQDPGILALNPMKLILVGAHIAKSKEVNSLEQLMIVKGWHTSEDELVVVEINSIELAQNATNAINIDTEQPYPTVYYVK